MAEETIRAKKMKRKSELNVLFFKRNIAWSDQSPWRLTVAIVAELKAERSCKAIGGKIAAIYRLW